VSQKRFNMHRALWLTWVLPAVWLVATYGESAAADTGAKSQASPEPGWKKVVARKGGCLIYVPADWKIDPVLKGSAGLDDNSASAVVSLADSVSSLADVKPIMEGNYKPTKTFEDSPHRLWYQYDMNARTNFYVGVPVKGGICGAQITFKPGKEAIANKIAASIGPAS
jgi:hypothetical protein